MTSKTTSDLTLANESGAGKCFTTGDDKIQVFRLKGSWREMGRQYGEFAEEGMKKTWSVNVEPIIDKKWATQEELLEMFGRRHFDDSSVRMKELMRGVADATGWSTDKVSLLNQSAIANFYQGKLHSFSGCSSLVVFGESSTTGGTVTARNMDWGVSFLDVPLYLVVYDSDEPGANVVTNLGWAGWLWTMTAVNDKGLYLDMHDGTSMGGNVVFLDRCSFLNSLFDMLVECDHAEAASRRLNTTRDDSSFILTIADRKTAFSFECPNFDSRRRNANEDVLAVVNTYMIPDWGIHMRETESNSLRRYANLNARAAEGKIDPARAMEIFDLTLFNKDGTFCENGGVTKPTKQDVDITDHQMVTDLDALKVWIKIPLQTEWREVDLKTLLESE